MGFISYGKNIGLVCFTGDFQLNLIMVLNNKLFLVQTFDFKMDLLLHVNRRKLFVAF